MKHTVLKIDDQVGRMLKVHCAEQGIYMNEWVEKLILSALGKDGVNLRPEPREVAPLRRSAGTPRSAKKRHLATRAR